MQRTVEQLIELITKQEHINATDMFLFNSLKRQLDKKLALSQKQHELVKSKLQNYKELFLFLGIDDLELSLDTLQFPLRLVNKDKIIRIIDSDNIHNKKYIEIKFPFNKKEINIVNSLKVIMKNKHSYYKQKNSHFFLYDECSAYNIVDAFAGRNFTVENELINTYEKIKFIKNNEHLYVPGIYNDQLKNVHKATEHAIKDELGEFSKENSIKFLDRKLRFGLEKIEFSDAVATCIESHSPSALKIASRKGMDYLSKPDEEKLDDLLHAIVELDRFPLLVILSDQISSSVVYEQLTSVHKFFSSLIENEKQSVLFRLNNTDDSIAKQFNLYIKDNKLNNWVDNETKIVYINYDKLPKLLLKEKWMPMASLSFSNLNRSVVSTYIESVCDLNIVREKDFSIIKQYKKNK